MIAKIVSRILNKVKYVHQQFVLPVQRKYARTKKMQSSDRRVFIDCGANDLRVLSSFAEKLDNFEFHAFEPQPDLKKRVNEVRKIHTDKKIEFYEKAVWIKDGYKQLYLATEWGNNYRGGSTLLENQTENISEVDYENPVEVETIDFERWINKNFDENDYIIVKMDIEGAEYSVLEKMTSSGNNIVDEYIVEFHKGANTDISDLRHIKCVSSVLKQSILEFWR